MTRTTAILAALLCISLGFSIGQATSQPAGADPQAAKIQAVRDTGARSRLAAIFDAQILTAREVIAVQNVLGDQPTGGKTIRELLRQICLNGAQFSFSC